MSVPEPRWPGVPQLRMRRPSLGGLPPADVPRPYRLRAYQRGDEAAWVEIMREGIGPSWTLGKWEREIAGRPQFDPAGLLVAMDDGVVVGSACAWPIRPGERAVGYIHMVAVRPEHRGRKLGYWLTLATLHYLRARPMREAILDTEDHRLPAIELYLRLGFAPFPTHESHAERWRAISASLGR